MIKYSKPLGNLLDFKTDFFKGNDSKLSEFKNIADFYKTQPQRQNCKNCDAKLSVTKGNSFRKLGVDYVFCNNCGHCNGLHEDTLAFCEFMYTQDEGEQYAKSYQSEDIETYKQRVSQIYLSKAEFLKDSLEELGAWPASLSDFGAGAGYFLAAAKQAGFHELKGFEPSSALISQAETVLESGCIEQHDLDDICKCIKNSKASVASFVGVLEHLQAPRSALQALAANKDIKYVYFSVPLFSPTVVAETVFPDVMPRHLAAGHTHLYTEQSIQHFCDEFGFTRVSEWWFGLDVTDFFRSVMVSLHKEYGEGNILSQYWEEHMLPSLDGMQEVLDQRKLSSEVHMLLAKT